jgi:hypothetical protein
MWNGTYLRICPGLARVDDSETCSQHMFVAFQWTQLHGLVGRTSSTARRTSAGLHPAASP